MLIKFVDATNDVNHYTNAPLGRVAVCTAIAAYSHRPFPLTICLYVSLCMSSALWKKTSDGIQMPFGVVSRTGPWMRQVYWGLGIGQREWVILGANMRRTIVTNGDF